MNEPQEVSQKRPSQFYTLPSTGVGKWSTGLLFISLVLILLSSLVVMPVTEQRASLDLAQRIFNLATFLCICSAGITGLFAIMRKRERSWVLLVSVLLLILATALNLGPLFHS